MKNILKGTLLCVSALLCIKSKSNAQVTWSTTPFTTSTGTVYSNLITNTATYQNVTIKNGLGANMSANQSLLLPITTGVPTPNMVYPFTVNGTVALWDVGTSDPIRNIIGLSMKGGIGIFSGHDDQSGSGIRLNSRASTAFPIGSVQTLSWSPGTSVNRAYEHISYNSSGAGTYNNIFSIDDNGDTRITGKIKMDLLGGDNAFREIQGLSPNYGMNIATNMSTTGTPTMIHMVDAAAITATNPGSMQFSAAGSVVPNSIAFDFVKTPSTPYLRIDNTGNTLVGAIGMPSITERLTVQGDIFLNTLSAFDVNNRNIFAKSNLFSLNMSSGTATDGSDGACFTANAERTTTDLGAIIVKSDGYSIGPNNVVGFAYRNFDHGYMGTGGLRNIFLASKVGQGIFGLDCDLSLVSATNDVFTIKESLGFYSPTPTNVNTINSNSNLGGLAIHAGTNWTSGATIEMSAVNNATSPGELRLYSTGTTGNSTTFYNDDLSSGGTSALHTNVIIQNNGQTIIGKDLNSTASGDVLTVKDQIGLGSATSGAGGNVNGNATTGQLSLHSNTGSANGATIEMYGPSYPTSGGDIRYGRLNYISYGSTGYGHLFANYDASAGGFSNRMGITKDGRVIIGKDLLDNAISHAPGNYNLFVQNGILTEHVRVSLYTSSDWSDYVFAKNYKLMPLQKVEEYVKVNKHLPDVQSADELVKDGIDLGNMEAQLMKKIEELTLYVIDQQKQIDELKKQMGTKK